MLAGCLGRDDIPTALADYASRRRPRTSPMLVTARSNLKMYNEPDPEQIRARNGRLQGMLRLDPLGESSVGWLYAHDPVAAAAEPVAPDAAGGGAAATAGGPARRRPVARAVTLEDRAGLWRGERAGYERFLAEVDPPDLPFEDAGDDGARRPRRRGRGPRRAAPARRRLHDGLRPWGRGARRPPRARRRRLGARAGLPPRAGAPVPRGTRRRPRRLPHGGGPARGADRGVRRRRPRDQPRGRRARRADCRCRSGSRSSRRSAISP